MSNEMNLNIDGGYFNDEQKEETKESNFMYVTVSMLIQAYERNREDMTIFNKKLNLIKVMGFVTNIEKTIESMVYTIDDTTGCVKAKLLLTFSINANDDDDDDENIGEEQDEEERIRKTNKEKEKEESIIKTGDLVQVFGVCNTLSANQSLTISVNAISKLESFDYLCHHHLLVLNDYLREMAHENKQITEKEFNQETSPDMQTETQQTNKNLSFHNEYSMTQTKNENQFFGGSPIYNNNL